MLFLGCGGKDDNSEAAKAQLLLPKVQKDLERIRRNYNSLSDQLRVVQHERDQYVLRLRQLTADGQNIEEMNMKMKQQAERIAFLEEQIGQLNATIESQQTTISQRDNTISELVALIEQQPVSDEQQGIIDQQEIIEQGDVAEQQVEGY